MLPGLTLTRRPEALVLDAGDTLLFFDAHAVCDALAAEGVELAAERLDAALHSAKRQYQENVTRGQSHESGWAGLIHDVLVHAGLQSPRARQLLPALRRAHDAYYFWRRVPEGLSAALERLLASGMRLSVVSNSEGQIAAMLERAGLARHFELIVDSHHEGMQKPQPEIFRLALDRLGVAAEHALYAGDIPEVDVLGPRAVGMHAVLVDTSGHYAHDPRWPRVESVAALAELLLALPAR
jgi:HAD superfamily hydrolase (TIGR01509 family)